MASLNFVKFLQKALMKYGHIIANRKFGHTAMSVTIKKHLDMITYNLLLESEKQYGREVAMNTIKQQKKLRWELMRKN